MPRRVSHERFRRAVSDSSKAHRPKNVLMDLSPSSEILVRGPNWVGDLVMATPGLRALRAEFPDARISLQLRKGLEGLMTASPFVDEVIQVRSYHQGVGALVREGLG